jgi:uncharacterized membrane protein YhhN
MLTRILSILFFTAATFFILLEHHQVFWPGVIVKALLMPLLILILSANLRKKADSHHRLMIVALAFSWAGDITLEFTGHHEMLFVLGLLFFMVTQILYCIVFFCTQGTGYPMKKLAFGIIPVYVYGVFLVAWLYPDLGDMRIPVMAYAFVILTMLSASISRFNKVSRTSYWLVLCGAVLFVLSDSLIAVNKFTYPFNGARVVIMSTYVTGQFLIVWGYVKQHRKDFIR